MDEANGHERARYAADPSYRARDANAGCSHRGWIYLMTKSNILLVRRIQNCLTRIKQWFDATQQLRNIEHYVISGNSLM